MEKQNKKGVKMEENFIEYPTKEESINRLLRINRKYRSTYTIADAEKDYLVELAIREKNSDFEEAMEKQAEWLTAHNPKKVQEWGEK